MRAGVVILNWNGGEQTVAAIESVRAQPYANKFVVLVDSDSLPAERAHLRERYGRDPEIECCFLDENRGYAGGNNTGIGKALARDADVIAIVTQDTTLAPGALDAMIAALEPGVGVVGPTILDSQSRRVLSLGERVSVPWLCVPRTVLRYRRPRDRPYPVGGILGCAMLLTRGCLEQIGGFDERFFAYYEEVDLCLRARSRGFKVVCAPQALAMHDGMRGFLAGFTHLSAELKARNLLRLMRRWATPLDWLALAPSYFLLLAGSIGLYAARGRFDILGSLLRGTVSGLRGDSGAPPALRRASLPVAAAVPKAARGPVRR